RMRPRALHRRLRGGRVLPDLAMRCPASFIRAIRMEMVLRPMLASDAGACAAIACDSAIGGRYGFEPDSMAAKLSEALASGGVIFVAEIGGRVVGFAWIDPRGAFSTAPYLRLIAVDANLRGTGVGAALLAEFESRTKEVGRDWCLLVSDFNEEAVAFYERHGYTKAGGLPGFAREGITEILMIKKRPRP
ncbi:MAG: GNAT family N-acetyltransferase, partial [Rectinemataceae bacterium]